MSEPLTKEDVQRLYLERTQIEAWLDPTPDPAVWPPVGWTLHPQDPNQLFRVMTEAALREELFGSPEKERYVKEAKKRLAVIDSELTPFFFPKPKPEGVQRKTKDGFVVSLKTGIKRVLDLAALPVVLAKCPKGTEDEIVDWKPSLKLKEWRDLPEKTAKLFSGAIIESPETPKLVIVAKSNEI